MIARLRRSRLDGPRRTPFPQPVSPVYPYPIQPGRLRRPEPCRPRLCGTEADGVWYWQCRVCGGSGGHCTEKAVAEKAAAAHEGRGV